jgi:hypothetical protein
LYESGARDIPTYLAQAIFGLVGVVIGGVLTGAVEWWHASRAKRATRRVAMRLVAGELREAAVALNYASGLQGDAAVARDIRNSIALGFFHDDMWREYRRPLAEVLPQAGWTTVSAAYLALRSLRQSGETDSDAGVAQWARAARPILDRAPSALAGTTDTEELLTALEKESLATND